ncbi:MAG TPA: TPM domain-containing protein [Polyangia bacterium]|jgi:uncharacterized membrane protein|nr:TPM domain-containing protein [Polyangia bacterium]
MVTTTKSAAYGIDTEAVERAIRAAELRTSGEICVAITRSWFWGDTRAAAERAFRRMGVSATRARNGVLVFVAPRRRKVVVLGDVGIHAKVAPDFWAAVVERITADFRRGDPTAGLVAAVELLGNALATAFPIAPGDVNELTNSVRVD